MNANPQITFLTARQHSHRLDRAVEDELRPVKKDLSRVSEERDILKKAAVYFARESR